MSIKNRLAAYRLLTAKDAFLKAKIELSTPPSPIVSVDDRYLHVQQDRSVMRNWGLIPGLIAFLFLGYGYVNDVDKSWKGRVEYTRQYIVDAKKKYGENYFDNVAQPSNDFDYTAIVSLSIIHDSGGDLKLSFYEYLWNVRYDDNRGGKRQLKFDIFSISFLAIGFSTLLYFIIRFKRLAPLVFDRKRKIFYTWRSGKVWVQRLEDLEYQEHIQGMFIPLAGVPTRPEKGKKTIPEGAVGWPVFRVMPHGNMYINDTSEYQSILVYITQFMECGREHVLPAKSSFVKKSYDFMFYDDVKPKNFDEQIEELLVRIEHNRPQWLEDVAAREEKATHK